MLEALKLFIVLVASMAGPPGSEFHTRAVQHAPVIWEEAQLAKEDPVLTAAQCKVETRFDHTVVGKSGERGLMQVGMKLWRTECADLLPAIEEPWAQIRCGLRAVKLWRRTCGGDRKPETWLGGYNKGHAGCGVRTKYVEHVMKAKGKRHIHRTKRES